MKVAVIGAGPAGLSAAYELTKRGSQVDVFEASGEVGGMARSLDMWGHRVDVGPHRFFSTDPRVNRLWLEVIGRDYTMVDRLTRIFYGDKFFSYPLKPFEALGRLGIWESTKCVTSYATQKLKSTKPDGSFENWVTSRFGTRLFEIFFKSYTEKLWGISCDALDSDFASQRIRSLTLLEVMKKALLPRGGKKHRTLVDVFAYPNEGSGALYERMAALVTKKGNHVHLNSRIRKVFVENGRATGLELADGSRENYDYVVSSMPLTNLVRTLEGVPVGVRTAVEKLNFRNTVVAYLLVDGKDLFPDNWLYVHSPNLRMGRITNFRNWVPSLYGDKQNTVLAIEYWCNSDEPFWFESDDALIELAKRELATTGLCRGAAVLDGKIVRVPKCYPVYRLGYRKDLENIVDYLRPIKNLLPIGRYGSFKYNNQDHSILMGILAAQTIHENQTNKLWEINSDYTYQEQALITATGLGEVTAAAG